MNDTLLPPSSTPLERAVEQTGAVRLDAMPTIVPSLWNSRSIPAPLLPFLAWSLSVDEWNHQWGTDKKRDVIEESRRIHQQKGTLAAIKRALTAIGQPDAVIVERGDYIIRNGLPIRDGSHRRKWAGGWASYRVVLSRSTTVDQAYQIKRLLASVQRNCVTLTAIDFRAATLRRNGAAIRNGAYTRGVVDTTIN